MTTDREYIAAAIAKVCGGTPLNRFSRSTIYEPNHCAQLVRESVEGGLGIRANEWEVGVLAHKYRQLRHSPDRFAVDYEAAGKALGLVKPFPQAQIGDVFYWPYKQWGHTALYAGLIGGVPYVLENSGWEPGQRRNQGARLPLAGLDGARPIYVFLSPLSLLGAPRQVIYPTTAIMRAETGKGNAPTPSDPQHVPVVVHLKIPLRNPDGGLRPEQDFVSIAVNRDTGRIVKNKDDGQLRAYYVSQAEARRKGWL